MLGIPEQTLLLVLLEMASEQYGTEQTSMKDRETLESALVAGVDGAGAAIPTPRTDGTPMALAAVIVSYGELIRRCGRQPDGGNAARQIRRELERLCEVTVWAVTASGVQLCSRLLRWRRGDRNGVQVVLNWRLTEVLIGRQFSPVSLGERLSLNSDIARALHCALSVRIRPGKIMSFRLDTLAPYVWPKELEVASSTVRRRRQLLRAALADIGKLQGWTLKMPTGTKLEEAEIVSVVRSRTIAGGMGLAARYTRRKVGLPQGSPPEVAARESEPPWQVDVSSLFN
ncbi:replication protein C, IncQ-type [Paraburkholderia sp. BR10936]|uniref:replication protein C, IncQ-type n=1 Tax=Paraburkholderia sp. BR10936 TaxID=3236993 RepID=UPI0034D1F0D5